MAARLAANSTNPLPATNVDGFVVDQSQSISLKTEGLFALNAGDIVELEAVSQRGYCQIF